MSWTDRLETIRGQKGPGCQLTKLTKPNSVSFVSEQDGRFHPIEALNDPAAEASNARIQRARLLLTARRENIDRKVVDVMLDCDFQGFEYWNDTQLRVAIRWCRDNPPSRWRKP